MDLKQIEKLMLAMEESKIKRVAIKREGFEIEIERECHGSHSPSITLASPPAAAHPHPLLEPKLKNPTETLPQERSGAQFVTSPMVGTFYASPSPEDPPFIKVGDTIDENTVVCIIEAMKVMNEVKAGKKGVVSAILVKNGEPVEFGTRIFQVDPS